LVDITLKKKQVDPTHIQETLEKKDSKKNYISRNFHSTKKELKKKNNHRFQSFLQ
jgi:hypothetical protein